MDITKWNGRVILMNLEWLYSFAEVAETKNLSKAAHHLNLTQPAVSKHIQKLEASLRVKLLDRSASGVEVTEAGKVLLKRIHNIQVELREIHAELRSFQQEYSLDFGALPSLAAYYLPAKVMNLQKQQVKVKVHVLHTSTELVHALRQGIIEAALIESKYEQPFFWGKVLFSEPYYVVVPKNHPLSSCKYVNIADFFSEPMVMTPAQCDIHQSVMLAFRQKGYVPNIVTEVAFGEPVFGYVAAGAGITVMPEMTARTNGYADLVVLPIVDFDIERSISLVARNQKLGERVVRKFFRA
jgi:LysR family transcriptional activator of glutamate synthase operon